MDSRCVILADSRQDMLDAIRGLLKTTFESVVMVADEDSLSSTIERLNPNMVVVDLSLPMSTGVNIARKLRMCFPDLKFIVLSNHDDPATIKAIVSAGANGVVIKRLIATDLMMAVDVVFGGKNYVSPLEDQQA